MEMQMPSKQLIREKKESVLDRIYNYHLKKMAGSKGNVFLISDTYPVYGWNMSMMRYPG